MADKKKEYVFSEVPKICSKCGGKYTFMGAGRYVCEACGEEKYDDFGKVRAYVDEHGATPGIVISEATGVSLTKINTFLRQGRMEIPDGSGGYIHCERCGEPIRYGRYCPSCAAYLTNNKLVVLTSADIGERPRKELKGKMHTEALLRRETEYEKVRNKNKGNS